MTTVQLLSLILSIIFTILAFSISLVTFIRVQKTQKNLDSNYINLTISIVLWVISILLCINYCIIMI